MSTIETDPVPVPQGFQTLPGETPQVFAQPGMTPADIQYTLAQISDSQRRMQDTLSQFMEATQRNIVTHSSALAGVKPDASASPAKSSTSVRVKEPRVFDGRPAELEPFLRELRAAVHLQRAGLSDSYDKAQYMLPYLKAPGRPSEWFSAVEKTKKELLNDFDALLADFQKHFESSDLKAQMQRKLDDLVQTGAASDYAASFYDIISHLKLTEESKMLSFRRGLKPAVLDGLALIIPQPTTLDALVEACTTIDDNQHQNAVEKRRRNQRNGNGNSNSHDTPRFTPSYAQTAAPAPSSSSEVVPMEIDAMKTQRRSRLTPEERKRRFDNKLCLYCGDAGHVVSACPSAPKKNGKAATSQAAGSSSASTASSGNAKKESK